jgi:demethylmenaquinone methyltransferase/2-methoxy-6-polyprenyl-1,4-benzoquinol methylase
MDRDVRAMFDRIAGRYQVMNALMTFGRDRAWRRAVVRSAALPPGGRLLDLASGTGDIALEALRHDPAGSVTAVDFSLEMMRVGRRRPGGARIGWCAADALALPFADATFDAVTSGYLLRNVADRVGAFRAGPRRGAGRASSVSTPPRRPAPAAARASTSTVIRCSGA